MQNVYRIKFIALEKNLTGCLQNYYTLIRD